MRLITKVDASSKASKSDIFLVQVALSRTVVGKNDVGIAEAQTFWPKGKYNGQYSAKLRRAIRLYQGLRGLKVTDTIAPDGPTVKKLLNDLPSLRAFFATPFGVTKGLNLEKIKANARIEANRIFLRAVMPNSDANALMKLVLGVAEDGLEISADLSKLTIERGSGNIVVPLKIHGHNYGIVNGTWQGQWDIWKARRFLKSAIQKSKTWKCDGNMPNRVILRKPYSFLKVDNFNATNWGVSSFGAESLYRTNNHVRTIVDAAYKIIKQEEAISGEAADTGAFNPQRPISRKNRFLKLGEMMAQVDKQIAKNLFRVFGGNRSGLNFRQSFPLHAIEGKIGIPLARIAYLGLKLQFILDPGDRKEYMFIELETALGSDRNSVADISKIKIDKSLVDFSTLDVAPFAEASGSFNLGPLSISVKLKAQLPAPVSVKMLDKVSIKNALNTKERLGDKGKNANIASLNLMTLDIGVATLSIDLRSQLKLGFDQDVKAGARHRLFFPLDTQIFDNVFYSLLVAESPSFERIN